MIPSKIVLSSFPFGAVIQFLAAAMLLVVKVTTAPLGLHTYCPYYEGFTHMNGCPERYFYRKSVTLHLICVRGKKDIKQQRKT